MYVDQQIRRDLILVGLVIALIFVLGVTVSRSETDPLMDRCASRVYRLPQWKKAELIHGSAYDRRPVNRALSAWYCRRVGPSIALDQVSQFNREVR
jgi:hypothetical protein